MKLNQDYSSSSSNRAPLTDTQQQIWATHMQGGTASVVYNEAMVFNLQGHLNKLALKQAFTTLVSEYDALRTSFILDTQENISQVIQETIPFNFEIRENLDKKAADSLIQQFVELPFDLEKPPLLRACLYVHDNVNYTLAVVIHHIIIDGTSIKLLLNKLSELYNMYNKNLESSYHITKNHNVSYIENEVNVKDSKQYKTQVNEIAARLHKISKLNFLGMPNLHNHFDKYTGDRVHFKFDKVLYTRIKALCLEHKVTVFNFLHVVYSILLSKYTRSNDLAILVPFANRGGNLSKNTVGCLINTLPISSTINHNDNFIELMLRSKNLMLSYLSKQQVTLKDVALEYSQVNNGDNLPLQTMLMFTKNATILTPQFADITVHSDYLIYPKNSKFDLSLFASEENQEYLMAYFEYSMFLFEKDLITKIADNFVILGAELVNNPYLPLDSITMMDNKELDRIKAQISNYKIHDDTKHELECQSLNEVFTASCSKYSTNIALKYNDQEITYSELEILSNQLANIIEDKYFKVYNTSIKKDTFIALCTKRGINMIIGILAILKTGAAYVPIDPEYPQNRIDYIIEDSKSSLLVLEEECKSVCNNFDDNLVINIDKTDMNQKLDSKRIKRITKPDDIAYVLYTSGSTGKPKGVMVTHENVMRLFLGLEDVFSLSEKDVWTLFHTYCFDISVWEIWGAFYFGGKLLIVSQEMTRDTKSFYTFLKENKVTVLTQTSSAFQMLVHEDALNNDLLSDLRYVGFVGESLKVSILEPWVKKYTCDKPKLVNLYGITETTVYTNYKFVTQHDIMKGRDNIGFPIPGYYLTVMDDNLKWCPVGVVGEIYVGGCGLSKGYVGQSDLTNSRFILDPYAELLGLKSGAKIYKTGDLGRLMPDGSIEYLGRKDFQVKLRGFRIELSEIEIAINSCDGVANAAVILKHPNTDAANLIGYYVVKPGVTLHKQELFAYIKSFLPYYMVPHQLVELVKLPITINGKVDTNELLKYESKYEEDGIVPLATNLEKQIAQSWQEILKVDSNLIGATSNFFSLGGNSVAVVKMLNNLKKVHGINTTIARFLGSPTIATIVKDISLTGNSSEIHDEFTARILKDITLDDRIVPINKMKKQNSVPQNIFLTGATGFVGAHLLVELLQSTKASVYCLVRATSIIEAKTKINRSLKKYKIYNEEFANRIVPVLGDLEKNNLGINQDTFAELADIIDSIYHVGALVHHLYDYETLYNSNVKSIIEILKLATTIKDKSIHFISTFGASIIDPINHQNNVILNRNGYLVSKWVSGELLRKASSRGIDAHIYYPGNIVASIHNVYEAENNHTLLKLKGMVQMKMAYTESEPPLELMPVDSLSKAIVDLSLNSNNIAFVFKTDQEISWENYLDLVRTFDYEIHTIKSASQWHNTLADLDENNALFTLAPLYVAEAQYIKENNTQHDLILHMVHTRPIDQIVNEQIQALIDTKFLPSQSWKYSTILDEQVLKEAV